LLAEADREEGNPYVCFGVKPGSRFVGIDKAWRLIRSRAGLPDLRLHDLRHSFASVGAAGGESLYVVGKLLGHSQPATTARYAHLADDPMRAAADRISGTIAAHLAGRSGEVVDIEEARRRA
jgi:integrase